MAQISFWGNQHGIGVTSVTAAISALIGMNYRIRTLMSQPQWGDMTLQHSFNKAISQYNRSFSYTGGGLDALERIAKSDRWDKESVKNNTLIVEKDRLDLLSGSNKNNREEFENSRDALSVIYEKASEYYQAILLDVHSGKNSEVSQTTIDGSDLVIVCLNQNIHVLEQFFKHKAMTPESLKDKPYLILLSQYDVNSKYKLKNISNKYGYKGPILTVPYNSGFRDAFNDGDVRGFFYRNSQIPKSHENFHFMSEVKRAAEAILQEVGIDVSLKQIEKGAS